MKTIKEFLNEGAISYADAVAMAARENVTIYFNGGHGGVNPTWIANIYRKSYNQVDADIDKKTKSLIDAERKRMNLK